MDALRPAIWLREVHWLEMQAEVARLAPEEACGLVAGIERRSMAVIPVENQLHSPVRFLMDAQQQVAALLEIDAQGWDLLAIYHSHPAGPAQPSVSDVAEAAYPEAVNLIWSYGAGGWSCQGYWISFGQVQKAAVYRLAE